MFVNLDRIKYLKSTVALSFVSAEFVFSWWMEGYWSYLNEIIIFVWAQICYLDCCSRSAWLYLFDKKKKYRKKPAIFWNIIVISNIGFLIEYTLKYNLSASWLQSSVSHDPSEIILICWFAAQEIFVLLNIFGTCDTFFFDSFMNKKLKRTAIIPNINLF